jgi:enolase
MEIKAVWAREILDSRGNPTVEVDVVAGDAFGTAAAPSGASTGAHEAVELRDGGERYLGKGVQNAIRNVVEKIGPAITGMEATDQEAIDRKMIELDGTENKGNLGANAMVATSMAVMRAGAASRRLAVFEHLGGKTLPTAMFNIINGGKHAGGNLSIQEFMIIPESDTFAERLRMASEIYHTLSNLLSDKYGAGARNVGDEGGFAPQISSADDAFGAISSAISEAGYEGECSLGIDAAADSFYDPKSGKYEMDGKVMEEGELLEFYCELAGKYPLSSIEDPFFEDSFDAFAELKKKLPDRQIVGDDLLVTNPKRIKKAIEHDSVNALLLKVNQIGTVTEALEAAGICRENNMGVVVSHRSGETEDSFIADLAVGIDAGQIKTGAPARGERTAKYNQLLRIEEKLLLLGGE